MLHGSNWVGYWLSLKLSVSRTCPIILLVKMGNAALLYPVGFWQLSRFMPFFQMLEFGPRFDEDDSGALSYDELSRVFGCLGMSISADQLNLVVKEIDSNNDGE